ncbi:MAG: Yip1 family protein [Roseinatronobacter sp.]
MELTAASVGALVQLSLARPREAADRLLRMNLPDDARWLGFVIVVVLSVILSYAAFFVMADVEFEGSILSIAMTQSTIFLATVVAVQGIGRLMGGTGSFPDTLVLIAWLQFVLLFFQLAQIVSLLLVPALFGLISIVSVLMFMWMLTHFVATLHGFQSALKVFAGIIFALFALSFTLALIFGMLGLAVPSMMSGAS